MAKSYNSRISAIIVRHKLTTFQHHELIQYLVSFSGWFTERLFNFGLESRGTCHFGNDWSGTSLRRTSRWTIGFVITMEKSRNSQTKSGKLLYTIIIMNIMIIYFKVWLIWSLFMRNSSSISKIVPYCNRQA